MTVLGMTAGWLIYSGLLAVPCFIFVAVPLGKWLRLTLARRLMLAAAIAATWGYFAVLSPGTSSAEQECVEHTPHGSGSC